MTNVIQLSPKPVFNRETGVWDFICKRCRKTYHGSHLDMLPFPTNICPSCLTGDELEDINYGGGIDS